MDISEFLKQCASTAYPEPESNLHSQISEGAVKFFFDQIWKPVVHGLTPVVLDVGCGSGFMYAHFRDRGWNWDGITLDDDAITAFEDKHSSASDPEPGNINKRDMHNLGVIFHKSYDLIWARHVLEHSPIPLKVLVDFKQILKPGGYLYLEMPAPDTQSMHAMNPNHYSVFDIHGWVGLIFKAGFEVVDSKEYQFTITPPQTPPYNDKYYAFYLRKPLES